jgi:hypothetical protein
MGRANTLQDGGQRGHGDRGHSNDDGRSQREQCESHPVLIIIHGEPKDWDEIVRENQIKDLEQQILDTRGQTEALYSVRGLISNAIKGDFR